MSKTDFDIVVIGAGPAGSAAAATAAANGLRVLLVDRCTFPRAKVCGDAVSAGAIRILHDLGIREVPGHRFDAMRLSYEDGQSTTTNIPTNAVAFPRLIERRILDDIVRKRALQLGADFVVAHATKIRRDTPTSMAVSLSMPNATRIVRCGLVLSAVGAAQTPLPDRPSRDNHRDTARIVAARTYVESDANVGHLPELHFPLWSAGRRLMGYGWRFPAGPTRWNVGAGAMVMLGLPPADPRALLAHFIERMVALDLSFRPAGALRAAEIGIIPLGRRPLGYDGVLMLGDAATLAQPLTGEGIRGALESGRAAIHSLIAVEGDPAPTYERLLHQRLPRTMRLRQDVRRLMENPELLIGRGHDLLFEHRGLCSESLRRVLFQEEPHQLDHEEEGRRRREAYVQNAIRQLLDNLTPDSPLAAELVSELARDPRIDVGRSLRDAIDAWQASGRGLETFPVGRRNALLAIELVRWVALLHCDLPDRCNAGTWGRGSIGITLADCLNAKAMELIYTLPPAWSRKVATASGDFLARVQAETEDLSTPSTIARAEAEFVELNIELGRPSPIDLDALPLIDNTHEAHRLTLQPYGSN